MTERELQAAIVEAARLFGWLVHHCRPARTASGWATPIEGDAGFPDLVLVRPGRRPMFVELKAQAGRVSREQARWLHVLALAEADAHVWRPEDWRDGVVEELLR